MTVVIQSAEALQQREPGTVFAETESWREWPEDGVERLMGNKGCGHLAQGAQKGQGKGIKRPQLPWISLALNFLSTIALFVQGNTHTQPGD